MGNICEGMKPIHPHSVLLLVANPVDVLTYFAQKMRYVKSSSLTIRVEFKYEIYDMADFVHPCGCSVDYLQVKSWERERVWIARGYEAY